MTNLRQPPNASNPFVNFNWIDRLPVLYWDPRSLSQTLPPISLMSLGQQQRQGGRLGTVAASLRQTAWNGERNVVTFLPCHLNLTANQYVIFFCAIKRKTSSNLSYDLSWSLTHTFTGANLHILQPRFLRFQQPPSPPATHFGMG